MLEPWLACNRWVMDLLSDLTDPVFDMMEDLGRRIYWRICSESVFYGVFSSPAPQNEETETEHPGAGAKSPSASV